MAAVPASSYKENHHVNRDYSIVKIHWFKIFQTGTITYKPTLEPERKKE